MLLPVEINSEMSHVTLAPPTRSALPASNEKIWLDGVVVLPPVVSEREHFAISVLCS